MLRRNTLLEEQVLRNCNFAGLTLRLEFAEKGETLRTVPSYIPAGFPFNLQYYRDHGPFQKGMHRRVGGFHLMLVK